MVFPNVAGQKKKNQTWLSSRGLGDLEDAGASSIGSRAPKVQRTYDSSFQAPSGLCTIRGGLFGQFFPVRIINYFDGSHRYSQLFVCCTLSPCLWVESGG